MASTSKTMIVTGASQGIGAGVAKAFLDLAEARRQALIAVLNVERLEDDGAKRSGAPAWACAAREAVAAQRRLDERRGILTPGDVGGPGGGCGPGGAEGHEERARPEENPAAEAVAAELRAMHGEAPTQSTCRLDSHS